MHDRIIDWLYGVLANPVDTLNEIAREKPFGWAFLVYMGVMAFTAVVSIYGGNTLETLEEVMFQTGFQFSVSLVVVVMIFLAVISIFIITLLLNLLARLFGGRGGYWNLFSAYAFANFPGIISVPVTFVFGFLGIFGSIISGIVSFGISIWVLVLQVLAVRESHGLSTGMSILAYIIALLILVVIPVVIIAGLIIAIRFNI